MLMIALEIMKEVGSKNKDEETVVKLFKDLSILLKEYEEEYDATISLFIEMSIYYIQHMLKLAPEKVLEIFEKQEDAMRSVVDIIKEKGIEEGMQRGVFNIKEMILDTVELKLGYIPDIAREKIENRKYK